MAPNSVRKLDVADTSSIGSALVNVSTIGELVNVLPTSWRSVLGDKLKTVYRVATKLCNVQNTIAQYERHTAEGSLPASIKNAIRDPKIQFSKEFLGSDTGKEAPGELIKVIQESRRQLLADALTRKKQELSTLQSLTSYDDSDWDDKVVSVAQRVAETFNGTFTVNRNNNTVHWTGNAPDDVKSDCQFLVVKGRSFFYKAISLARAIADQSLVEKTKTLSLKKDTDIAMRDTDVELSTRDVVRDEMQAQMRLLKQDLVRSMGTSSVKRRSSSPIDNHASTRKKVRPSQKEGRLEPLSRHERAPQEGREQEEGQSSLTVAAFLQFCSKDFRPWAPDTYPTVYNSLTDHSRMMINVALSRTWELDSHRAASPGVFKHPDVHLPEDIEYMLAVNHKFIFHQAPARHDVNVAKEALRRKVRNISFFHGKDSKEFIPKFHVPNPRWNPPPASSAIELGLEAAMRVIDSQVSQALASIAVSTKVRTLSSWAKVQNLLMSERYVVKLTDKNLGLAVLPAGWYDTQCLKLLTDTATYRPVFYDPTDAIFDTLHTEVYKWRLPRAMENYILSRTKKEMPQFHIIPKVHKTPWTARPIVPSHSWVTTTCSEVIDHLCQPLLEHFPWVVNSSKRVVNQIEKVRRIDSKPVWILTGDVTAFYTNIPPKDCSKIIGKLWRKFQSSSSISPATLQRMTRFVMDNNFLNYKGQSFHQMNGLAMGTSCAPVIANLYAAWFEWKARVTYQDGVLMYVRYIDDILCLFQGTQQEAQSFCGNLKLGPLDITWAPSIVRNEFLDIEIMAYEEILPRVVHTRLYRKPMNRHLYIPWSSAHPSHVKKGFVKAELIRFAILCSRSEYFAEARREFYGNLRRRGYPAQTLNEWFKQVTYDDRPVLLLFHKKEEGLAPLMLSGHYNPVWDYVDVKEVITEARRFWVKEELPEALQEPLIRSLGRTANLFDLMSTWNKTILLPASNGEEDV